MITVWHRGSLGPWPMKRAKRTVLLVVLLVVSTALGQPNHNSLSNVSLYSSRELLAVCLGFFLLIGLSVKLPFISFITSSSEPLLPRTFIHLSFVNNYVGVHSHSGTGTVRLCTLRPIGFAGKTGDAKLEPCFCRQSTHTSADCRFAAKVESCRRVEIFVEPLQCSHRRRVE